MGRGEREEGGGRREEGGGRREEGGGRREEGGGRREEGGGRRERGEALIPRAFIQSGSFWAYFWSLSFTSAFRLRRSASFLSCSVLSGYYCC